MRDDDPPRYYSCVVCRAVHVGQVVNDVDEFWIGKRRMCCMAGFAKGVAIS